MNQKTNTKLEQLKNFCDRKIDFVNLWQRFKIFLSTNQRFLFFVSLIFLFLLMALMFFNDKMSGSAIILNCIFILPLFSLFLVLLRRSHLAFFATAIVLFIVFYIDEIVYASRLVHLRYADISAIGDGIRVASKYNFAFTSKDTVLIVLIIVLSGLLLFISHKTHDKQNKKENFFLGGAMLLITALFVMGGSSLGWIADPVKSIDDNFDVNSYTERAGLFYAIYGQYINSSITTPEGYSKEIASQILSQYNQTIGNNEPIDVIVIMNEGLTDYSLTGIPSFADPLVNIHNPENNYFEGKLMVSVFGGYTCNTEFEFLTGASMQFLPTESIPFSQFIVHKTPSIAQELKESGMSSYGVHPYYSQEWNRRNVYANLGFDDFIAGEDFSSASEPSLENVEEIENITNTHLGKLDFGTDLEYIRGFVSDEECYRKVLELLDTSTVESNFIFAVTVQNHGGFDYSGEDFQNTDYVAGVELINQYLTLSSISDQAFHDFIGQVKERGKKTIVLMFGDHQPGLDFSSVVDGYSDSIQNRYIVPYIVWSNFDIKAQLPISTSANYLSAILKNSAGLTLTAWDQFRLSNMSEYPVITGNFSMTNTDQLYSRGSTTSMAHDYSIVQYNRLFDNPSS